MNFLYINTFCIVTLLLNYSSQMYYLMVIHRKSWSLELKFRLKWWFSGAFLEHTAKTFEIIFWKILTPPALIKNRRTLKHAYLLEFENTLMYRIVPPIKCNYLSYIQSALSQISKFYLGQRCVCITKLQGKNHLLDVFRIRFRTKLDINQ